MNKENLLMLIFCSLLIVGCVTEAQFKKNMDTWIGTDMQKIFDKWGNPIGSFKDPENGNTVYDYSFFKTITTPVETNIIQGVALSSGGDKIKFTCKVWIETNEDGIIQHIKWQGNDCVAAE